MFAPLPRAPARHITLILQRLRASFVRGAGPGGSEKEEPRFRCAMSFSTFRSLVVPSGALSQCPRYFQTYKKSLHAASQRYAVKSCCERRFLRMRVTELERPALLPDVSSRRSTRVKSCTIIFTFASTTEEGHAMSYRGRRRQFLQRVPSLAPQVP